MRRDPAPEQKGALQAGRQSIVFGEPPCIVAAASVTGKKEGEGPLGKWFDLASGDDLFGENTWEAAEGAMQTRACALALQKAGVTPSGVRFLFGGDLLRQGTATTQGVEPFAIPMFGLYGACSTAGEALALAAMTASAGYADRVLAVTSSHFGSAEKEFRFPLGYASQRPLSAHWTVTGSGAFLVEASGQGSSGESCPWDFLRTPGEKKKEGRVHITGVTTGKIVDYGLKDSQNMGACMAPAACDTILANFRDFGRGPQDYSRIITGDLGYIGQSILFDLMAEKGYEIRACHLDCGILIFDQETQDTHNGGSGCGCAAVTLASYILPRIRSGEWERVLFVPTGALLSTVIYNEGVSVPGIAHGIVLEHEA